MLTETTTLEPTQESTLVTQPTGSIFDDPEPEEQSSVEAGESEEVVEGEAQAAGEETDDEDSTWLPSEQLKEFPADVIARYAKRYGYSEDELTDPRIQRILKDKINSDVEIANRIKLEKKAAEEGQEETPEEELEPTQQLKPEEAQAQREQRLNAFVDQVTDPQSAKQFVGRLAKADAITDPDQRALEVTKALTFGMANVMPDLLLGFLGGPGGWLEQQIAGYINANIPGLAESHFQSSVASTVDAVRASNPKFATLPRFGTPEWKIATDKVIEIMPEMESFRLYDPKTGKELPRLEQVKRKTEIMFRLLTNTPGAVQQAEKAIDTGKLMERESVQRKALAKLGAGQSKGLVAKSTGNDDIFGAPGEISVSHKLIGKQS